MLEERARAGESRLWALLEAAGGVTGSGSVARVTGADAPPSPLSDDAGEFIRLELSAGAWPIGPELAAALRAFGDGLAAGDLAAARRWLASEVALGPDLEGRLLLAKGGRHSIVACARVGEQRLVKLRVDGSRDGVTLLLRWAPVREDWRIAAIEPVSASAARLA
jgi:hypothetical protein